MPESYKEFTYHNLDNEKEVVRICVTRQNLSSVLNSPVRVSKYESMNDTESNE